MTAEESKERLKKRIEELCIENGISRMQLSQSIGANRNYIYNFYCGHSDSIDAYYVLKIAEYFDVSTDYIYGLTDEKSSNKLGYVEHDIKVLNEKIAEYNFKMDQLETIKYAVDQTEKMYSRRGYIKKIKDYIREYDTVNNIRLEDLNVSDYTKRELKKYFLKNYQRTEIRINDLIPLFKSGKIGSIIGFGYSRCDKLRDALIKAGVSDYELDGDLDEVCDNSN